MENKITITGNNINTIEIPQRITNVVEVLTGPIGPRGEIPTSGSFNFTGSYNISGSLIVSGSIISTDGFTGSLEGTSSWANNSISASFAQTASFLLGSIESASFALTASFAQTASFLLGSVTSASFAQTASFAQSSLLSQTSSYIQLINVDGFVTYSSSIDNRISNLENFSSSLDTIFATDAELNAATSSLSASISYLSSSYLNDSASFNNEITNNTNDISSLSSSFISFSSSYNTGSFTGSFTGSLFGTSSWANNSISSSHALNANNSISASHALTASYVNPLQQNVIITGSLFVTQSNISTIDYIDFNVTPSTPSFLTGRLHWTDDTKTLQLDTDVSNFELEIGHQNVIRGRNVNSFTLTKGTVVYIDGESGNRPTFATASWEGDPSSATTIGIIAQDIISNQTGYAITSGLIRGINTNAFLPGTSLYLSSSGHYTSTPPFSPLHEVRLGKTITQSTNGVLYVDIQNGYELGELHDVLITSASSGDLVVWNSGSRVWMNTKQLTGSYALTGSLQAISFTGSLLGTSSYSSQALSSSFSISSSQALNADSSSFSIQAISSSFAQTASFAPDYVLTSTTSSMLSPYVLTSQTSSMSVASSSVATSASYAVSASHLIGGVTINTGSLLATASVNLNTITFTKGDGSTFPITVDTGSGGGGDFKVLTTVSTPVTISNTSAETIYTSLVVNPADNLVGAMYELHYNISKGPSGHTSTFRIYINTSAAIGGTKVLENATGFNSNTSFSPFFRYFRNSIGLVVPRDVNAAQTVWSNLQANSLVSTTPITFDSANTYYIVITTQMTTADRTETLQFAKLTLTK